MKITTSGARRVETHRPTVHTRFSFLNGATGAVSDTRSRAVFRLRSQLQVRRGRLLTASLPASISATRQARQKCPPRARLSPPLSQLQQQCIGHLNILVLDRLVTSDHFAILRDAGHASVPTNSVSDRPTRRCRCRRTSARHRHTCTTCGLPVPHTVNRRSPDLARPRMARSVQIAVPNPFPKGPFGSTI